MIPDITPPKLWTRAFIGLTVCSFLLFLNLQMMLSSFPSYVKGEFHSSDVTVSLVTSLFALAAIATRFGTAGLMRRVGATPLLLSGITIAAVSTILYPLAHSILTLLLLRVLYGIGFGMASTIVPTRVSRIIPKGRIGEGIGYFGLSTSLAMSIGPLIGMNIMKAYGFQALSLTSCAAILLTVPVLIALREPPSKAAPSSLAPAAAVSNTVNAKVQPVSALSPKAQSSSFFTGMGFPALLNVLTAITYSGLLGFIALFGQSIHLEQIGLFFLFNAITLVLVRPFSGRLYDSKGPAAVLFPAALCLVASLTVLSYATSMPLLIVSALLYGLGFGAIQPTLQAWMLRSSRPEKQGLANSMFYNSTDFGVASGAFILGGIASAVGYSQMYLYSAGFMVLFLVLFGIVQAAGSKSSASKRKVQI